MRMLNGFADPDEEAETLSKGEVVVLTVLGDGLTMDQLHDEIGASGRSGARIID